MNYLANMGSRFSRLSKASIIVIGFSVAICLEVFDFVTGQELRLVAFYFVPIFLITWFAGIIPAVVLSVLSAVSWYVAEMAMLGLSGTEQLWNAFTRFAVLIIFTYMVNAYKRERIFARQDFLTKIANSQHFAELAALELERCRRYGHPFSLVYMDIDDFKLVNDRYGHTAGNDLLYRVAQTIRKNIRAIDIVARLGGDEFAILLPETNYEQATIIVPKLRRTLLEALKEQKWQSTFSFGMVTFFRAPQSFDDMIKRADDLMYEAKLDGKNRVKCGVYE